MDSERAGDADVVVPVGSGLKAVTALAHAKRSAGSPKREGPAVALANKWNADKEVSELSEMDADMARLRARRATMQAELQKEKERHLAMIAKESVGKAPTDTAEAGDAHHDMPERHPAENAKVAVSQARSEFTRAETAAPGQPEINEADLSRLARGDRVQSSSAASTKPYQIASDPASMELAEKFKQEWIQKLGLESSGTGAGAATDSADDGSSSGT